MTATKHPPKIPYGQQWIGKEEIHAVARVLKSDYLTQGPTVEKFERVLAKKVGARYAVAVANGTAALHLAAIALGLKPGDEVITTPISFLATSNAALYVGAKPVFVDIEPHVICLNPKLIERKITRRTKAIFVTDFAGHPADLIAIRKIAKKHGLKIVEDACHALGATYHRFNVGACAHADLAVFSFHPVKHITTGEGGAVTTNDPLLYERLRLLRSHGMTRDPKMLSDKTQGAWYYEMHALGFNYRLTDIQAALGNEQLKKLDRFVAHRRAIAGQYCRAFQNNPALLMPTELPGCRHVYHLFVVRLKGAFAERRKAIFSELQRRGIGVQVHYIPIPAQPYYRSIGFRPEHFPKAWDYYRSAISLPMYPKMTGAEVKRVIATVQSVIKSN